LHWYGQQKLTAKSIKPTQKKTKYNYTTYIHMHTNIILTNVTKDAYMDNLTIPIQN